VIFPLLPEQPIDVHALCADVLHDLFVHVHVLYLAVAEPLKSDADLLVHYYFVIVVVVVAVVVAMATLVMVVQLMRAHLDDDVTMDVLD
jgi:hypothetical protein